jgi:hypothetical protein
MWKKLKKGIGKLGGLAKKVAPFTAFIPGVNIGVGAAALLGGLGGAAEKWSQGGRAGDVLGAGAKYGALGGAGNWAGGKGKDFIMGRLGQMGGGEGGEGGGGGGVFGRIGGGIWDGIKGIGGAALGGVNALGGGNTLLGAGALGLLAANMHDQREQRKAAQAFEQQRFDMMSAMMGKAEADYDARVGLRSQGYEALTGALGAMKGDTVNHFLDTLNERQPGEFIQRPFQMG